MVIGLVVCLFVGVVATIVLVSVRREKQRTAALAALARSLNFSFVPKADKAYSKSLEHFHLFSHGHSRRASNLMRGQTRDIDVTIMDYRYTTGSGNSSHTWVQTVILFQSDLLRLPAFTLRPENLFHRIGSAMGYQDIDFDSHPAFSRQYLLRGSDEDAVRRVFSDDLLTYYDARKGLSTEGSGNQLVFYRIGKRVPPRDIQHLMEEGFAVFSFLKSPA